MSMKKIVVALAIVAVVALGVFANINRKPAAIEIDVEKVKRRDLTAIVSGSGRIRAAKDVDISANVMGRITDLRVVEGQEVDVDDMLLQIDPVALQSAVNQVEASIESAKIQLRAAEENHEFASRELDRQEGLFQQDLTSKAALDQARQAARREERNVEMRAQDIARLEAQIVQSRHSLSNVTIRSPIAGIITQLNVEQGENVVTGTMNNAGTVLLRIADLSVVEAEIEIDETDIVSVELGQAAEVRIDAFPDVTFDAQVVEVGKSPIGGVSAQAASGQAINFKVVVRVVENVPGARPGLSCTADITTKERAQAIAVPIQALMLRELEFDEDGNIIKRDPIEELLAAARETDEDDNSTREVEGAFVLRDGEAVFVPVEIGIAGERHFEALEGFAEGDDLITGPFDVLRTLQDGEQVKIRERPSRRGSNRDEDEE